MTHPSEELSVSTSASWPVVSLMCYPMTMTACGLVRFVVVAHAVLQISARNVVPPGKHASILDHRRETWGEVRIFEMYYPVLLTPRVVMIKYVLGSSSMARYNTADIYRTSDEQLLRIV